MALFSECRVKCAHNSVDRADIVRDGDFAASKEGGDLFDLPFHRTLTRYYTPCHAAFCSSLAASFRFSAYALIAGPNCAITASRLKDAAFWRGGYLTKLSSWAATRSWHS